MLLRAAQKSGVLEKYKYGLARDKNIEVPELPDNKDVPYPLGRKNQGVSMEEPIRWALPQIANNAGKIRKYKEKYNVNITGEGAIAPPPCTPQPLCRFIEGSISQPLLLLRWKL